MASTSLVRRCKSLWIHPRQYSAAARRNTLPSSALHSGPIPYIFQPGFNPTPHSVICPSLLIYPFLPKYKFLNTQSKGMDSIPSEKKSMKRVQPYHLFQSLRYGSKASLLALDVGADVIKLAVAFRENEEDVAEFKRVLHRYIPMNSLAEEFENLILEYSIVGFVFGCDKKLVDNLDDEDNDQSVEVKHFVEDLSETGKLGEMEYAYWDDKFANDSIENHLQQLFLKPYAKLIREKGTPTIMLLDFLKQNLDKWHELGEPSGRTSGEPKESSSTAT